MTGRTGYYRLAVRPPLYLVCCIVLFFIEAEAFGEMAKADCPKAPDTGESHVVPQAASSQQSGPDADITLVQEDRNAGAADALDLATAQRRALMANPSLHAVAEQVAQAREYVRQARSLYFPQLSLSYRAMRTRFDGDSTEDIFNFEEEGRRTHRTHRVHETRVPRDVGPDDSEQDGFDTEDISEALRALFGSDGALDNLLGAGGLGGYSSEEDTQNYTFGVTAGLLLFDGFSRRMTSAMARFGREETKAALQEARRLLLDAVALSFYGVQLARENIQVARSDKEFNARLVKEVTIRHNLGKASLSDVLNFEVRQQAAEAALLATEKEYETARIALALVMGEPDVRLPDGLDLAPLPEESDETMRPPDEAAAIRYALEHRPDLQQKGHGIKRAQASVKERYGALSPRVSLFASWNDQRMESGEYERKTDSTTVGVDVAYDVFTGGRKVSRILEARHAKRQAEFRRAETEQKVISDVRKALLGLRIAQQQIILQRTASENVRRNRDLVEKEYQAGKAPLVRLNQGQRDLVEAQARLAFARVNLIKAWHELRTSTAETLEAFPDRTP
ncbi:MAG TPA: TolC family protein [Candidatus Hydrogenedentes bacterium]|nr:TolC family protein [Candidatus Hydrogenedentota bacterium]